MAGICPDDYLLALVQPDWAEEQPHEAVVSDLK